ncbi:hypothetical protein CKM354_001129600 [Cercospora kikuchii]|uniref:Involucrin repeat protein n=1 Tax=Cercospora kikuchii TaxID=84275 RepID=A0A9P3FHY4_9PEZI|nr:uncharacterized protein CKM354_001129600 [Cercospora kikuchii]GIZ48228.1 hypothetical protein CKM354_001129600 [Cercospora kikuchii]
MWKAAFTGRSEKGGDRERDTQSASGRSEVRRKKSSRSSRGDVDDTASVMSGTSRRHRSSRHESSSRYGDDDDRVKSSSRYEDDDRDRMQDSSYYSGGPPSVYGSAMSYASPGSGSYATAPTSRVSGETRPLTASALRMLPDDDGDEDDWEDDEKTVKSERRRKKRSPSDEREKRRKSSGKEKERKRSSSRERKDKLRSEKSKEKSSSRRNEPELVTDSSRAIPAMGSFEQFPGQYGGGVMGQHQQPEYTMSGALPNVVPQSQFPGQDHPAPYEQPAPQLGISRADSYGHAADYYLDEGQSVAFQPGFRASTPNMLVNPDHHLMAASSVPVPAQDTGNGSAADFYNDTTSYSAPVTPARPSAKPGKQSSSSASEPSKTSKPSRTSSGTAVAAGLAGIAGAAAVNKIGKNGRTSSSHHHSQSEYTTASSYQSRPGGYPPTLPSMTSQSRPSRHSSDGNVYYASAPKASNGAGASFAGSSAYGPSYENTYGTGNVPGAAAAGAAAYGIYQNQHKHGRNDSNTAVAGDYGGNGQGPPRSPRPAGFSGGYYPPNGNNSGGMMQQGHYHEHKGPMTKLKDGLLNLISTPEDVAKMEMYTEYIGVCKYCFDPRTSAWDAPRVHHYHKRRDSFESLRRRVSKDRLQHKASYERVDKESRYYASDSSRRRREERNSGMGLAGAGLAAVGTGLAANALFNSGKNFDDTYSVKSGHRESSAVRRRSRSSSREKRRQSQYGTIRPGRDEFANVTIRRKDGTIEHRRVARSRSGSGGRKSGLGMGTAVAAGAALGAAGLAAGHRSRSSSRERRRRLGRVSSGQSEYSRYDRDDRRQSEEGGGGIFGNFFSPPRKQRRESREHQKKRAGFFTFSNGSASSSNSDLAFGGSALSRKGSKASLSRRSSGRSTRGRPQRKSSDQHLAATLAGIGATAAALGAAKAGHRITKRTSRPELGARRHVKQHVVGDHRHGSPGSSDEEGWEDELPSDDASSNDGLAFGDYGGKHLSGRQSLESVASQSSAGGLGAWGWRWGGKDKKRNSRRSTSGELPYPPSEYGSAVGPIGAGIAASAAAGSVFDTSRPVQPNRTVYLDDTGRPLPSVDARSSTSGASSQPLQYIDPKPVSDVGTPRQQSISDAFGTPTRVQSMPGAFETEDLPIYRPGPGVVQHPQPMSPARPAFTQPGADAGYTATVGATDGRPIPRRSQSSPVQSTWGQDAAMIGAGVLGAGAIIAGSALSSGRKSRDSQSNVRFGLTDEQERKETRSTRQEDKKADEERRRADRTRALKEEAERAAKEARQEEVLRAREADNRARAQARLDLEREQQRKAEEEARVLAEKRAHEERERQWEIERLEKEAADRQAAAAAATAEFERQRLAREEAERRQAEVERETREREEALRRQQYELAEEARREDEQRRQWDAERYAREYQQSARNGSARDYQEDPRGRRNDESSRKRSSGSGWTTVAAGAAAAAGVGAVMADRDAKKRRQRGKSDSTDDSPVSRRPPRTSVDWNADAFADDREAAEQAELDRQARNQYGQASRGSVERKNGYAATEIKPGSDEQGEPIMDDDIFNPDFFMQSQHSPADRARHEELARKAADKVVAERARAYSPDSRPKENYADFFADEIKDVLAKKPGEKERNIQPDSDVQVYHVEEDGVMPPFALRNDFGGKSKHAPYGVPRLNVIAPTPPPGSRTTSTKGSVPSSPLSKAADGGAERSPDSGKDSKSDRSRSISWGEDEVNVYDVQTPESFQEKDRESYITGPDLSNIGKGVAAAAGAAVAGAALHDIVVEEGDKTKTYKDEDFTTASSKKSKKDKKKSKKGSKSNADDADSSFLDELSQKAKTSTAYEDVPPERGTEVPYKETEFSRTRKDNERDRQNCVEETMRTPEGASPGTLPHPVYQQPFFDSVSDFSGFRAADSPGTEGAPPVRGFIEGEVKESTPVEEKRSRIPGGFDDEQNDTSTGASRDVAAEESAARVPLSKKEKKKREKEAKRASSGTFDSSEPSTPAKERDEPVVETPLSAKEKKKREKEAKRASSASFDVEPPTPVAEPEEPAFEPPLSAKEKKKRDKEAKRASVTFDEDPVTPVVEREAETDTWEPPLSAKERKKREKAAKKAGIDPAYSEEPTPVVESPKADTEEADEYFPSTSSKDQKASQFEDGLRRIASTQSAISMPSWSGDTVVSDVTAKPPSPELSKSEQRKADKQGKKSAFSFADVTDTILASGGVAAAAATLNDSAEESASGSSKKDKKKKRKSKLGESSYDDPRDAPSGMPGGWDTPERKSSPESAEVTKESIADPLYDQSREIDVSKSAPEPVAAPETDPGSEWFESTSSSKKTKKKGKRSSVAFDSTPQVSSPLRSEVAWDDYVGMNGDKVDSEAGRSDPITVIERRSTDDTKDSRQSSTQDEFYDAGPRVSESPRDMSPEDARSVNSADGDKESRRKSRREEARRASDYYEQPQYAYEAQSTVSSEPADGDDRKKHKRRSRHEDDDTMSVSSSRRRSRHLDDDDDTRSVTSSRSRREKEESPNAKKEKKGIFGSLFGRKSSETVPTMKDLRDEDDEDRRRRKKKHRESEYGDDDDDTRSVKSESHRRRHRSTDEKDDNDSPSRDPDITAAAELTRAEKACRDTVRTNRKANTETVRSTIDDELTKTRSPDTAVEWKEGRPLEAGSGTGLVSAAAAGLAVGVAASALSRGKKGKKGGKKSRDEARDRSQEREVQKTEYAGPLPSAAAHSFPLPYVPEHEEVRAIIEEEDNSPQTPAPVLEKPARPVSIGRPGSSTAVPLRLPGHAPTTPGGKERAKSFSSPLMTAPGGSSVTSPATPGSSRSRQSRPHSSEIKSGIMPLYLVERSRPVQEVEDTLPSLPSSKPSSRASSVQGSDEYESAREEFSVANSVATSPDRTRSRSLTLDTIGANNFRADGDILGSEQTTPKASEWPQTAIPWALPTLSGEKKEKQQPQFYTWEDFAQDERLHEQERTVDADVATTIAPEDSALLVDAPRSRSASPSKAKALAAAAMLGTAAVYAAHKSTDRSPERVVEAKRDEPLPSAAAHSFPLPYVPTAEPEQAPQQSSLVEAESPRKLEDAFEPVTTSKKSKKKGKKGKKSQVEEVETPQQIASPVDAVAERSIELTPQVNGTQDSVMFPSAAAHTIPVVPAIEFTEPSPEKDKALQAHGNTQQSDSGYFASAAAHSMPVYDPIETSRDVKDRDSPPEPYKLPGAKSEPAPLVIEQRNVQVEPPAETVEVTPAPQLTRKQSKKDKKKAKRTSIFEDEPKASVADDLPLPEADSLPAQDADRGIKVADTPALMNFGLSDFGAVAAGGAIGWGLSQADAFRKSMQNVRESEPKPEEVTHEMPNEVHAESIDPLVAEKPAETTEEVFEPISSKKSKKGKKKSKQSSTSDVLPEVEGKSGEIQDLEKSVDAAVEPEQPIEPVQNTQSETVQGTQPEPNQEFQSEQNIVNTPVDDDWTAPTTSKKKSKKDKKKRLSMPAEPEVETAQAEAADQQDSMSRGVAVDAPQAEAEALQSTEKNSDQLPTAAEPFDVPSAPFLEADTSQPKIENDASAIAELVESVPDIKDAVEPSLPDPEPADDLFPEMSTKKGKKSKKKQKALAEEAVVAEKAGENEQEVQPDAIPEATEEQDRSVDVPPVAEPAPEETVPEASSTADNPELVEDASPASSKKKSKKEKRKSKTISLDESEKPSEHIVIPDANATESKPTETAGQKEPVSEQITTQVEEIAQDSNIASTESAAPVEDFAPTSKKKSKKDKRKSKTLSWDEPEETPASQDATVDAPIPEAPSNVEVDASAEKPLELEGQLAVDATEPKSDEPDAGSDLRAETTQPEVVTEVAQTSEGATETPKDLIEESLPRQAAVAEDEFSQQSSKKKGKKSKKQKQLDSSWEPEQADTAIPAEIRDDTALETDKSAEQTPVNTDILALGTVAVAGAVAASALASHEDTPAQDEAPQSAPKNAADTEADDVWGAPVSKKKSKKDKRKSKTFDFEEPRESMTEAAPQNDVPDAPIEQDLQTAIATPEAAIERGEQNVDSPTAQSVEEEKPTLSRKQSKKDKKKKKSLSLQVEEEPKVENDPSVETPKADLGTVPAASDPAGEVIHQADREAADEVPQPTETPDDSFHDAEDFFEAQPVVDSWHDAEEAAVPTEALAAESTPTVDTFGDATSTADKDITSGQQVIEPAQGSWADMMDDTPTIIADTEESSAQKNNLVDDVFGIASDAADFSSTPEGKPADHGEIMPDRGAEFEPERASEDMDAFGDPTPRDPAEWSLGTSKKGGKKGKKGKKSVSKAPIIPEPVKSSSSEPAVATATALETPAELEKVEVSPNEDVLDKSTPLDVESTQHEQPSETPAESSEAKDISDEAPLLKDTETSMEEQVVTSDAPADIQPTANDAQDVIADPAPANETATAETDDFSWPSSSKKKKGKKGKKSQQSDESILRTETQDLVEETSPPKPEDVVETEQSIPTATDPVSTDILPADLETVQEQETILPATEEPEVFTAAPLSKKDKKKAKKAKKSGSQTPQATEEPSLDKDTISYVPDSEQVQSKVETAEIAGEKSIDLVTEAAGPSDDHAALSDPAEPSEVKVEGAAEDVVTERARDDQEKPKVDAETPLPELDRSAEEAAKAEQQDVAASVENEDADFSWAPTSKKSKKGKKNKKSVTEIPASNEEEKSLDPNEDLKTDVTTPAETSIESALAVGGAAVAAGLLASSTLPETSVETETSTPTQEATDDFAWPTASKKKAKKSKKGSKSAFDALPEPGVARDEPDMKLETTEPLNEASETVPNIDLAPASQSAELVEEPVDETVRDIVTEENSTPVDETADDLSWASGSKRKGKKGKKGSKSTPATEEKEDQSQAQPDTIALPETSGDVIPETGMEPALPEPAIEQSTDETREGPVDITDSAPLPTEEPEDLWGTTVSSKKKKGKKGKKSGLVTPVEQVPEAARETANEVATSETAKETDQAAVPDVAELEDKSTAEQAVELPVPEPITEPATDADLSKNLAAEEQFKDAEAEISAPTTELPVAEDDFADFSTSKKKKGKKGRKSALLEVEESTPKEADKTDEPVDPTATNDVQVFRSDAPEPPLDVSTSAPETPAGEQDDFASFTTSKKKKKGKKNRKSDIWATDEAAASTDASTAIETADQPKNEQTPKETPIEIPEAQPELTLGEEAAPLVTDPPADIEPTAETEDIRVTPTSSKNKKGKKNRKSGLSDFEETTVAEELAIPSDSTDLATGGPATVEETPIEAPKDQTEEATNIEDDAAETSEKSPEENATVFDPSNEMPSAESIEEDPWGSSSSSKRKKGKKGKKSAALEIGEAKIEDSAKDFESTDSKAVVGEDTPADTLDKAVDEPAALDSLPAEPSNETQPIESSEDFWASSTSSKKKKGKKGRKSGVFEIDEPKADEKLEDAPVESTEQPAETAEKLVDEQPSTNDIPGVPEALPAEPVEAADDIWDVPAAGKKKKGKKGRKSDIFDMDEPKADESTTLQTIEKSEDVPAGAAAQPTAELPLAEESAIAPDPTTAEPTATTDDLWATPTTGKKKKGKKGKKSGTVTPAVEEVDRLAETPQASEGQEPGASEQLPVEETVERAVLEQAEESGAVDFDKERGDNTNPSDSLTSEEVKDAVLEHETTEKPENEPMIEKSEVAATADATESTEPSKDLAGKAPEDAQPVEDADDWFAPQSSKKQKKKGKKNKSAATETNSDSVTEPSQDVQTSELTANEELRTVEDVVVEEQPAAQPEKIEPANADDARESQAADTDDLFTSSSKSSKKAKKGKKSKQVSLEETPIVVGDVGTAEEARKSEQQDEPMPDVQLEPEVASELQTQETHERTAETDVESSQPDVKATDTAVTETIDLDQPAEALIREKSSELLPAENTGVVEAQGEDVVAPEVVDSPTTQEVDDLFTVSSSKKKGKKGKKGKQSVSEDISEPPTDSPKVLEETIQDESVPQSTATTSQEATEAESENVWALPVKGKKGKKAKKLQQLAAENLQAESQAEDVESRPEAETSTSDAQPSTEADADDLWAVPSTGKKSKKGKKARRDAELAIEEPSVVPADLDAEQPKTAQAASIEAVAGREAEEDIAETPIHPLEQPADHQNATREVHMASEGVERAFEEPVADKPSKSERSDGAEFAEAAAGAVAAAAAIAVATASTEDKDAATTSDVYDWGAVSTKKSKKDKKKARKSGSATPAAALEQDPAPTIEDVPQAEQSVATEDGQNLRTIDDAVEVTTAHGPVVEEAPTSRQLLDSSREVSALPVGTRDMNSTLPSATADNDIDFTATVAAGLADTGFNPDMVINDPAFQRRASPTGVAEADPEEDIFSTTVSKRKKKGKRNQTISESPPVVETADEQPKAGSDVDDILNKTLASTGFDATLLEKAMVASREQSPTEAEPESEFAFTTTKRKKGKKGKQTTVAEDEEANKYAEQARSTPVEEMVADAPAEASREEPSTPLPVAATDNNEHSWMVQDEMDVDAMDKAYKAYKKNKRQQKKLKARSGGTSDNPESSAVDDTERSAVMSEAEDTSAKAIAQLTKDEVTGLDKDVQPTVKSPGSATSSNSIVQSVFPGLERIKRRVPPAGANADGKSQDRRASNDSGSRGLMHTSEVSQNLPMEVPRSPIKSNDQPSSLPALAAGVVAAGIGMASATREDKVSSRDRTLLSQEPSWSFAALQDDDRAFTDPAKQDAQDRAVRDSGYETAKRSSQQTDRSSAEVPQIVRTSSSRDSLLQRRSLEPLRVSTPTSPDWDIHTPKQRRGNDSAREVPHHERKLSDNTPLEPTKAALSPSQLPEQPSPIQKPSSTNHSRAQSASVPAEHSPALSWDGNRDRSAFSPTSPRAPLDAIPEEHARRQHSRKRSKARAEVGGPENIKAVRRTETPKAIRAQEEALSPSNRRHRPSGGGARSVSSPTSTSDEVFNRLPWPQVDQENETVQLDRSRARNGPLTPDLRSASVLSDRSNVSGNHFKSPHEMRSYSRNSNSSSTPSLRRTSLSGDLRAASKRGGSDLGSLNGSLAGSAVGARASPSTIAFEPPPTPPLEHDELIHGGASRAMDTSDDVFQGYGDAQRSQVSPTRPPSVRKRQSMHINDLETRLDLLVAENRALQEARQASEGARGLGDGSLQEALEARDLQLQAKDAEINQIKAMLQPLQDEVARLTELSNGLTEANRNLVDDTNGRYATLQAEHAEAHSKWQETAQELDSMRSEHGRITSGMRDIVEAEIASSLADKNAEILRLREQLDIAAEQIRALQVQIQSSKSSDFLVQRDEDYFDGACQKLCQHVQQWVLRFSKMSDNRVCRLSTDLNDDKIEARLDNAVLDGSDVDKLLGDRVRRRDVFMSVVMTMVWEYIFTRYLFGMDREQRQKLKALEKLLAEVGPPRAVAHWRATTLTLLSKRPQFDSQCALDTEAVAHEIFEILCMLLPPPSSSRSQLQASLQKVLRIAVDLAIEMRTQRAEYIMLPPLQPEYDTNGDLVRKVYFNSSLMNERSGLFSSNEELAAKHAVVKIVLFPLVVKKGDDVGEGDDEIVVCPAQVLVHNDGGRDKKIVRVMSGAMEIDEPIRSRQSNRSLISEAQGGSGF